MLVVLAIVTGILYAAGIYMLLQRSIVKLVFGLVLLSHAANLLIFTSPGLTRHEPALIEQGQSLPEAGHADPVPQALILTAIVISFAVLSFAAVLVKRVYDTLGTDDVEAMRSSS